MFPWRATLDMAKNERSNVLPQATNSWVWARPINRHFSGHLLDIAKLSQAPPVLRAVRRQAVEVPLRFLGGLMSQSAQMSQRANKAKPKVQLVRCNHCNVLPQHRRLLLGERRYGDQAGTPGRNKIRPDGARTPLRTVAGTYGCVVAVVSAITHSRGPTHR